MCDEAGKPLCRWCKEPVPKGSRSWCSTKCVDEYRVRAWPGHARKLVKKRDKGMCGLCGLRTIEMWHAFHEALWKLPNRWAEEDRIALALKMGLAERFGRQASSTWWHMDHIIPVSEGGGACGLENLRTLCLECHYTETVKLRIRLADKAASSSTS